ncbi:MAG: hypothetical protein H6822_06950 [Planctomycetaceae bacterium]|nr:hypothetical protein [Planctomycetales bacterium]MCB9921900.1 hypothetical protein [Planctomycetaceae bacterium]
MGWKHEYCDGAGRASPQATAVADFKLVHPTSMAFDPSPLGCDFVLRPICLADEDRLIELFTRSFDDSVEFASFREESFRKDALDSIQSFLGTSARKSRRRPESRMMVRSFVVKSERELFRQS